MHSCLFLNCGCKDNVFFALERNFLELFLPQHPFYFGKQPVDVSRAKGD